MPKRTLFLVDAHGYLHRSYHAIRNLTNSKGEEVGALFGFERFLSKLIDEKRAEYAAVCFDSPGKTFRSGIYPEYKANRKKTEEGLREQLALARDLAAAMGFKAVYRDGYEADDLIASIALGQSPSADIVIVSSDKDICQIVGEKIRLWDGKSPSYSGPEWVEKKYGVAPALMADYLAIVGDSSDNIPGVKGIGPKGAVALLRMFGNLDGILAASAAGNHEPKISRLLAKVSADREMLSLSRKLVSLKILKDDSELDDYRLKEPSREKLGRLAERLEFRSLLLRASSASAPASEENIGRAGSVSEILSGKEFSFLSKGDELFIYGNGVFFRSAFSSLSAGDRELVSRALSDGGKSKVFDNFKDFLHRADFGGFPFSARNVFDITLAYRMLRPSDRKFDFPSVLQIERGTAIGPLSSEKEAAAAAAAMPEIKNDMSGRLSRMGMMALFREIEIPLVKVIWFMEKKGVRVDEEILERLSAELEKKLAETEKRIYDQCGYEINLNSPKQISWLLYEKLNIPLDERQKKSFRTKTGYSTNEEALLNLAGAHPVVPMILEYREYSKLKSSFIDNLRELIAPDGRVHTTYEQEGTSTGRFSSSRPNLQNIPVRSDYAANIRKAFAAPPGRILISADYSQIDLRVLAHLSGDEKLVDAFIKGEDIHARTAGEVFGKENVNEKTRKMAKGINFGIIYGQTPYGLAKQLGIPEPEAAKYIEHYFGVYSGVKRWIDGAVEFAERNKYAATFMGRRRDIPEIDSKNANVRGFAARVAVNTPVQGGSADIIKKAMVGLFEKALEKKAEMIMQVHDELIFEVDESAAEAAASLVKKEMENAVSLRVPLKVDVKAGRNWGEMEKLSC